MMMARDAGGSRVAMMAARVEDGGSRQRQQRQMTMVADDDGGGWRRLQDWGADYGEGQEQVARDGGGRGSGPEFPSIFFSGGRSNFSKLLEEQKNRQTVNKTSLLF
jgi:hypothetical protein